MFSKLKLLFNPYWQILENSSRNFSEISVLRDVTYADFWKIPPIFFRNFNFRSQTHFWKMYPLLANPGKLIQKLFRNFGFPGCDTDGFLENSSIFGWVFQESVCVKSGFLRISFFDYSDYFALLCSTINALFWIIKLTIGWVFHKSV